VSNKEFFTDWVSEVTETSGDLGAYFSIESATEAAWDHQQSKLDAKDELLKEAVAMLLEECPEVANFYDLVTCDRCQFLNKPEIKQLRGE